jgi:hypothetical protein
MKIRSQCKLRWIRNAFLIGISFFIFGFTYKYKLHKTKNHFVWTAKNKVIIVRKENVQQFALPLSSVNSSQFKIKEFKDHIEIKTVNKNHLVLTKDKNHLSFYFFLIIILILCFVDICFFFFKTNRNVSNNQKEDFSKNFYLDALIHSSKNFFTVSELDSLFGINELLNDSRKLKRHRIINELNKQFPGLITRIKDDTDRRRNIYQIHLPFKK